MTMEKRGVVNPQQTPDTEKKLSGEKQADSQSQTRALDDDVTKRLADKFADKQADD